MYWDYSSSKILKVTYSTTRSASHSNPPDCKFWGFEGFGGLLAYRAWFGGSGASGLNGLLKLGG